MTRVWLTCLPHVVAVLVVAGARNLRVRRMVLNFVARLLIVDDRLWASSVQLGELHLLAYHPGTVDVGSGS